MIPTKLRISQVFQATGKNHSGKGLDSMLIHGIRTDIASVQLGFFPIVGEKERLSNLPQLRNNLVILPIRTIRRTEQTNRSRIIYCRILQIITPDYLHIQC